MWIFTLIMSWFGALGCIVALLNEQDDPAMRIVYASCAFMGILGAFSSFLVGVM